MSAVTEAFRAKLRALRRDKGDSCQTVANATGIPRARISDLENRPSRGPSVDELLLLAKYFGLSADLLLDVSVSPRALLLSKQIAEARAALDDAQSALRTEVAS